MFDLELVVQHRATTKEEEEMLSISFIYATDVFEQQTVQLMMDRFFRMIKNVFEAKKRQEPIRNLSLLLHIDRDIIEGINQTLYRLRSARYYPCSNSATCTSNTKQYSHTTR